MNMILSVCTNLHASVHPFFYLMRGLNVRPKLFKSQMWLLKKLGYKGLNMTELQPYLTGKKQGKVVSHKLYQSSKLKPI
jgi:peptidoglycan/xylan/chitin deacetylase (PgdA/CDA1 family)